MEKANEQKRLARKQRKLKIKEQGPALFKAVIQKKKDLQIPTMSAFDVKELLDQQDPGQYKDLQERLIQVINQIDKHNTGAIRKAAGLKVYDSIARQVYDKSFSSLSIQEKRKLFEYILADDLGTLASGVLKVAGPMVMNHFWDKIKQTHLFSKAKQYMKDYLGVDLNDDQGFTRPNFNINPSLGRVINWEDYSNNGDLRYQFDAVSIQAICTLLAPELTGCRIPSDIAVKCGLVHRTQTFTASTNAAGNLGIVIYPQNFDNGFFYGIANDATFSPSTGAQTPTLSYSSGPMTPYSTTINSIRLGGFSVQVQPIVSSLNNQGRCISIMSDRYSGVAVTSLPFSNVSCRDQQYCVYSSLPNLQGHRLVYDNSSVADENFTLFGSSREQDAVEFIIEGAQASTSVVQIVISYTLEYTVLVNPLIEITMPPVGPATMKAWDTALSVRPDLRLLGCQEVQELYSSLVMCQPNYRSVMKTLLDFNFTHRFNEVIMAGRGGDAGEVPDFSGISGVTQVASM